MLSEAKLKKKFGKLGLETPFDTYMDNLQQLKISLVLKPESHLLNGESALMYRLMHGNDCLLKLTQLSMNRVKLETQQSKKPIIKKAHFNTQGHNLVEFDIVPQQNKVVFSC